jgi:hypothetical protein
MNAHHPLETVPTITWNTQKYASDFASPARNGQNQSCVSWQLLTLLFGTSRHFAAVRNLGRDRGAKRPFAHLVSIRPAAFKLPASMGVLA